MMLAEQSLAPQKQGHLAAAPSHITRNITLTLLELTSRGGLAAGCFALARGGANSAVAISVVAIVASTLRAFAGGGFYEAIWGATWRRVFGALASPTSKRPAIETVPLVQAVFEQTAFEANLVPAISANAIGFLCVLVATALFVGPAWSIFGIACAAPLGLFLFYTRRRVRAEQYRAWSPMPTVTRDLRVLLESGVELRANGRQHEFSSGVIALIDQIGSAERRSRTWSSVTNLFPASVALIAVAAPARAGIAFIRDSLLGDRALALGVLGLAGAAFGFALAGSLESVARSAPSRATLQRFLAIGAESDLPPGGAIPVPPLAPLHIRLEHLSCSHDGVRATPSDVSFDWRSPGLVVLGENGAGKSTLALSLLGLVKASGALSFGDVSSKDVDWASLRRRVTYVAQDPFVDPEASVEWHLRGFASEPPSRERAEAALERVGLLPLLRRRTRDHGAAPWSTRAGDLSGGEQQRMHLARALASDAELVILDEPDASLDSEGRGLLKTILDELATTRRVLVVAHDDSIVPKHFARIICRASLIDAPTRSPESRREALPVSAEPSSSGVD